MNSPDFNIDDVLTALRDDLPSDEDDRRMRVRLRNTIGVSIGSGIVLAHANAVACSASAAELSGAAGLSGAAAGLAGAAATEVTTLSVASAAAGSGTLGIFSQVAALSTTAKALLTTTALAASVSIPAVVYQSSVGSSAASSSTAVSSSSAAASSSLVPSPTASSSAARSPLDAAPSPMARAAASDQADLKELKAAALTQVRGQLARAQLAQPAKTEQPQASQAKRTSLDNQVARTLDANAGRSLSDAPSLSEAPSLHEETLLLERALHAAGLGDKQTALKWIELHKQRFPEGALAPERERTRARLNH